MTEQILGGVLMIVGGGTIQAASALARQYARDAISELFGSSDDLSPLPADMAELLDRLP